MDHKPCLQDSHPLPSGRGTSLWMTPGLAPPPGPSPRPTGRPTGGATTSILAVSKWTSDSTSWSWASPKSQRAKWNCVQVSPSLGEGGGIEPPWVRCRGARVMPVPHGDIHSSLDISISPIFKFFTYEILYLKISLIDSNVNLSSYIKSFYIEFLPISSF